ncbi:hypothetical protein ONZ45_g14805 [Pleurotus djamor]|nr:hypothetical protein ONZ45_g14805 [Pleurotus djamor]
MATNTQETAVVERHPKYYMDTFVEDQLFKLPKQYFTEHSPFFSTMFSLPQGEDTEDGTSDANAISLPVSKLEFERFLDVLTNGHDSRFSFTQEHWLAALQLGTKWDFRRIRQLAAHKLSQVNIPIMDCLEQARLYDIRKWEVEAYSAIVQREESITEEEALQIGYSTAFKLSQLRERQLGQRLNWHSKFYLNDEAGMFMGGK